MKLEAWTKPTLHLVLYERYCLLKLLEPTLNTESDSPQSNSVSAIDRLVSLKIAMMLHSTTNGG